MGSRGLSRLLVSSARLPALHCPGSCPCVCRKGSCWVPGCSVPCSRDTLALRMFHFQMMHLRLTGENACPVLTSGKQKPGTGSSGVPGHQETLGGLLAPSPCYSPPPHFLGTQLAPLPPPPFPSFPTDPGALPSEPSAAASSWFRPPCFPPGRPPPQSWWAPSSPRQLSGSFAKGDTRLCDIPAYVPLKLPVAES